MEQSGLTPSCFFNLTVALHFLSSTLWFRGIVPCVLLGDFLGSSARMSLHYSISRIISGFHKTGKAHIAYFQLAVQCQSKGSHLNLLLLKRGAWDFKKRTNKLAQWVIVCSNSNRDDTERYKKHTDWSLRALCWHCVAPKHLPSTHCFSLVVNRQEEHEHRAHPLITSREWK